MEVNERGPQLQWSAPGHQWSRYTGTQREQHLKEQSQRSRQMEKVSPISHILKEWYSLVAISMSLSTIHRNLVDLELSCN